MPDDCERGAEAQPAPSKVSMPRKSAALASSNGRTWCNRSRTDELQSNGSARSCQFTIHKPEQDWLSRFGTQFVKYGRQHCSMIYGTGRRAFMDQDTNAEILGELRSMRRHTQYGAYFSTLLALVVTAFVSWSVLERQRGWAVTSKPATQANAFSSGKVWSEISAALDEGDDQKAVSIAKDFVSRRPNYYYAHELLGTTYIAMNDFTNAESAYVRVVELYPDEEASKTLTTVRLRLARDRGAAR